MYFLGELKSEFVESPLIKISTSKETFLMASEARCLDVTSVIHLIGAFTK